MAVPQYRAEVWDLPHKDPWNKIFPSVRFSELSLLCEFNDVGYGRMTVGGGAYLTGIIDTNNDHGSLIRVFDETNKNVGTFYAEHIDRDYDISQESVVHGPGIANVLDTMVVLPKDGLQGPEMDWIWGDDRNILQNGDFEDVPVPNAGFEDGNSDQWEPTPDSDLFNPPNSFAATLDAGFAHNGSWYLLVNPNGPGSGVRRTITGLIPGEYYVIQIRIRDPGSTGDRWRIGVSEVSTAVHTNAYEEDGYWWAEIENAPEGTGASDGTWQITGVNFRAANETVELVVVYQDSGDPNFGIDTLTLSGDGVGLNGWEPVSVGSSVLNDFDYSTAQFYEGSGSLHFQGNDHPYISPFGLIGYGTIGASQNARLEIGKRYTASVRVRHNGSTNENIILILRRITPRGGLARTPTGYFNVPGSAYMASKVVSVAPNTWTEIEFTREADVTDVAFQVRYVGDTSGTNVGVVTSPDVWVDKARLVEGEGATTAGSILRSLLAPIQTRGVGDWLNVTTFSATITSDGNAWSEDEMALRVPPGQTMLQVLDALVEFGIEWQVEWNDTLDRYELRVYNHGELGVDRTATLKFHPKAGWRPVKYTESLPTHTALLGEGDNGIFSYQEDSTASAAYGVREGSAELSGVGIPQVNSIDAWLIRQLAQFTEHRFGARVEAKAVNHYSTDWGIGDTVTFAFPGTPIGDKVDRIASALITVGGSDEQAIIYSIDFVKPILVEPFGGTTSAPTSYVLNRFLRKFRKKIRPRLQAAGATSDKGGMPSVMFATVSSSEYSIAKADFIFDLVDSDFFQSIANILGGTDGQIYLAEGVYVFSSDIDLPAGVDISGTSSDSAFMQWPDVQCADFLTLHGSAIKNVRIMQIPGG